MASIPPFSAVELKESFLHLERAMRRLREYISSRTAAPFSLAPHIQTQQPHELIADTLCNLFYPVGKQLNKIGNAGKTPPTYGVISIDDEGAELVGEAQDAKKHFYSIAAPINAHDRGTKRGIAEGGSRSELIQAALAGQGLKQLWLQQCYRQLHLIAENPLSVSFTWQRAHSARVPLTLDKAIEFAQSKKTFTESERDAWVDILKAIDLNRFKIVKVKSAKAPQLKANIMITPGRAGAKYCLSSPTIILLNTTKLPSVNYKSLEEIKAKPAPRRDKVFSEDYALGFLNLYALPLKSSNSEVSETISIQQLSMDHPYE